MSIRASRGRQGYAFVLTALLLAASPAAAEWSRAGGVPSHDPILDAAVDGDEIVAVANGIDMSDMFAPFQPRIFRSTDGGRSFVTIHGALGQESSDKALLCVAFSGSTILGCRGDEVVRSISSGGEWETHSTGDSLLSLAFLDEHRVVGAGVGGAVMISNDGGVSFHPGDSGTGITLRGMLWRGERGWAWGYDIEDSNDEDVVTGGVLIESTDGGESWTTLRSFSDVVVGPAWFDEEGLGFVGVSTPASPGSKEAVLSLYRSMDGGSSWTDTNLPTKVGEVRVPFLGIQDLDASYLSLIDVDGTSVRLVTMAYVMEGQVSSGGGGGGSGGTVIDLRIAGFESHDLGESWLADDLGEIEVSMTNITSGDGYVVGGALHHLHSGTMVVQDGRVWRLETPCDIEADCFEGYECVEGLCAAREPEEAPDDEPGGDPENGGEQNGGPGDEEPGPEPDDADGAGGEAGGCDCSAGAGGAATHALLLLVMLVVLGARFRSRSRRVQHQHGAPCVIEQMLHAGPQEEPR